MERSGKRKNGTHKKSEASSLHSSAQKQKLPQLRPPVPHSENTAPLANICLQFLHSSICEFGAGKDKKRECPLCILEKRIARSLSIEALCDAPAKISSCLRIYAEHFHNGRQDDAHEFLRYVIDACHNTCLRLKKLQLQQRGKSEIANGGAINGTSGFPAEILVRCIISGDMLLMLDCHNNILRKERGWVVV